MKRITSILLLLTTILSSILFTACGHECTLAEGWRNNTTSHWHACTDPDCTKQTDLAHHTWDVGVITKRATQEAPGVKTFVCTECMYQKTQNVAFQGLTEEEWNTALSSDLFINFTCSERTVLKKSGMEIVSIMTYEFEQGKGKITETIAGETASTLLPLENLSGDRQAIWMYLRMMTDYQDYYYEARSKSYKLKGVFTVPTYEVPVDTASVKFKNGRLSEISYTCKVTVEGTIYYLTSTINVTNYDTTKIS